jgi:hypothetical protein
MSHFERLDDPGDDGRTRRASKTPMQSPAGVTAEILPIENHEKITSYNQKSLLDFTRCTPE